MKLTDAQKLEQAAFIGHLHATYRQAMQDGYGDDDTYDLAAADAMVAAPSWMTMGQVRQAMEDTRQAALKAEKAAGNPNILG